MLRMHAAAAVGAALALGAVGCGGGEKVARVVDGRRIDGAFVEPDAYAEFLRGVLAEEDGALDEALRAYERARALDDEDPEIDVRIAEVRCRRSAADPEIARALDRALSNDPTYAPALAARARCAPGDAAGALASAREAARQAPRDLDTALLLARTERDGPAIRERLLALTLVHPRVAAFEALGAWAISHDDAALSVHALSEVARRDALRRPAVAARAVELAGLGDLAAARTLAGAVVDAGVRDRERSSGGLASAAASVPLVARLAVDDAIVRDQLDVLVARASAAHLSRAEVGARALLLGRGALARTLAAPVVLADPSDAAARIVVSVATGAEPEPPRGAALPAAVALVYARAVAASGGSAGTLGRLVPGDALLTSVAVDLAARGAIAEDELPVEARIELAIRRQSTPLPEGDVDARHTLLRLAHVAPRSSEAIALGRRLATRAPHDALVGAAIVRLALAAGTTVDAALRERLVALSASDPVLCAALLAALPAADAEPAAAVRASLRRLAATPAERALSL
jgi:hypothetical protein